MQEDTAAVRNCFSHPPVPPGDGNVVRFAIDVNSLTSVARQKKQKHTQKKGSKIRDVGKMCRKVLLLFKVVLSLPPVPLGMVLNRNIVRFAIDVDSFTSVA